MTFATYCSACDVGDCDNHHPGHTQEGVLGGWRCVCDHDPERAERRREWFANRVYGLTLAASEHDASERPEQR